MDDVMCAHIVRVLSAMPSRVVALASSLHRLRIRHMVSIPLTFREYVPDAAGVIDQSRCLDHLLTPPALLRRPDHHGVSVPSSLRLGVVQTCRLEARDPEVGNAHVFNGIQICRNWPVLRFSRSKFSAPRSIRADRYRSLGPGSRARAIDGERYAFIPLPAREILICNVGLRSALKRVSLRRLHVWP